MKRLLILLLFMVLAAGSRSQDFVDMGLHLGYNASKFITNLDNYQAIEKKSLAGGGFIRLGANMKYYVQLECYLANKSGMFSYDGLPNDPLTPNLQLDNAVLRIRLTTVNIPMMAGYNILSFPESNLRVMAGPVVSWVIGENITLNSLGVDHSSDLPPLMFRDKIWSFQYGFGMDIWRLTFNFRHELTLQNLSNVGGYKQKGSIFLTSVGYKFL